MANGKKRPKGFTAAEAKKRGAELRKKHGIKKTNLAQYGWDIGTAGQVQQPKLKLKKAKVTPMIAKKPYVRKSLPLATTPKIRKKYCLSRARHRERGCTLIIPGWQSSGRRRPRVAASCLRESKRKPLN